MKKLVLILTVFSLAIVLFFSYKVEFEPFNSNHYALATELYDGSENVVSAIYLNFRLYDTLFELLVFSVAVTGVSFYAKRIKESGEISRQPSHMVNFELFILGIFTMVWGIYTVVTGHLQPGGAFSGGAIAASGLVLFTFSKGSKSVHQWSKRFELEKLENAMIFIFLAYAIFSDPRGGFFYSGFGVGKVGDFFSGRGALLLNSSIGFKVFIGGWIVFYEFSRRKESI